jgi:hypothetical protein
MTKLARTLRFLCDLALGWTLIMTAFFVIWMLWLVVSPVIMGGSRPAGPCAIFVMVGSEEPPGIYFPVTIDPGEAKVFPSAQLYNTTGLLTFKTSDWRVQFLGRLHFVVFWLLILGFAYMARQFLVNVIDGIVFTLDNARRLKWIGWFLLGIGVVMPLVHYFVGLWALSIIKIQSPTLHQPLTSDWILILVAAFVLILSAAFRHGVELEKEHSLTV